MVNIAAGLFALADGMGGHRDGHVASNIIMETLERTMSAGDSFENRVSTATQAIEIANRVLYGTDYPPGSDKPYEEISGATVLALIVGETQACCLWAGDSRLYMLRDGFLYLVSEDHTASNGALTRAVGSSREVRIDRRTIDIMDGDIFLLCSDGLLKGMKEADIAGFLHGGGEALGDRMLAKAIAGGSTDDITVILVWVGRDER